MSEALTDLQFSADARQAPGGAGRAREPLAEMAEQIRRVDAAAATAASHVEEAARRLRGDAAGDFRSQLLADLGTSLVERVNEIHAECDRLSRMLERATRLASGGSTPIHTPAPSSELGAVPQTFDTPPEPQSDPAPRLDRRRAPGQSTPEGVRLAATQMAVAGSSRSEIERVLRIQFGVNDADMALDEIFGTRSNEVR